MSIFEVIMLVCFGAAWPSSIYKSYRSRTAKGKSVWFLYIVFAGYVAGTMHKLFHSVDWVICLYIANGIMVLIDILLYYRNRTIDERIELTRAE
ncbi:MAG: hypothetical protein ABIF87_06170 [Pseudomonadota bacterium]